MGSGPGGCGKTKDYKIGICWFSAKVTAFRRKSKDWIARSGATCLPADRCFGELTIVFISNYFT